MTIATTPFIIDTDPGVDDAMAIMYALLSRMPVLGLTTVFGNVDIDQATVNALTILQMLGDASPVSRGSTHALKHVHCVAESHGYNGLSGFRIENIERKAGPQLALEFTVDALRKGPIGIIAIGPSTNVAHVCRQHPELLRNLKELVILGGCFQGIGNTTPHAEFNVFNDPEALRLILECGLNPVLITQEICQEVVCTREDFSAIGDGALAENIRKIVHAYIGYYEHETHAKFLGGVMYDVLAVAYMKHPSWFTTRDVHVRVNVDRGAFRGKTTILEGVLPNARLVTGINAEAVHDDFLSTISQGLVTVDDRATKA